jgi:NMD protein affecting ribosome stability and mRNA decay
VSLSNCIRCGVLFANNRLFDQVCNDCFDQHEKEFHLCKDYIRSHPTTVLTEISEKTGVPLHRITEWIREGRIQIL